MREALAGLTVRGRAFVAAGVTAIVCAIVLGQPSLSRVGVLVLALPLVSAVFIGRSRYRLALVRTVNPQLVAAGQPASVSLSLANEGRTPSGVLLLEDHLPYVLGTRPRFVLEGIGHGWHRDVTYQIRSDVRGRFEIGPVTVRVKDPFGLVELGRAFRTTVPLTVTPRTVPAPHHPARRRLDRLRRQPAAGLRDGQRRGRHRPRVPPRRRPAPGALAQLGAGRASSWCGARSSPGSRGRRCSWTTGVVAHRGQGIASSLEAAVSAAASIAVHLSKRGFTVRLVTAAGEDTASDWHARDADLNTGPLLEALAVVQPLPRPSPRHRVADRGRRRRAAGRGARPRRPARRTRCCAGCTRTAARRSRSRSTSKPGSPPMPPAATPPRCSASRAGARSRSVRPTGSRRCGRSSDAATPRARGRAASCPPPPTISVGAVPIGEGVRPDDRRPFTPDGAWPASRPSRPAPPWSRCSPGRGSPSSFGDTLGPLFVAGGRRRRHRRARLAGGGVPRPLIVLAQVLLVGMVASAFICGSPLPMGEAWDRLIARVHRRRPEREPVRAAGAPATSRRCTRC